MACGRSMCLATMSPNNIFIVGGRLRGLFDRLDTVEECFIR